MKKRNIIWLSDKQIDEMEEMREKHYDNYHFFATDEDDNHYYWFVVEAFSWGFKTKRYYLGVEDENDDERCNHLFWFSTNCDDGEPWMYPSFDTPQAVRDYIRKNDFIYKV